MSDDGEVWMDTPDDCPAYQDAYEWESVEVTILTEADVAMIEQAMCSGAIDVDLSDIYVSDD